MYLCGAFRGGTLGTTVDALAAAYGQVDFIMVNVGLWKVPEFLATTDDNLRVINGFFERIGKEL